MSTVGFGDLTGRTQGEYVFSMILEMYGVLLGSALVVVVTQFVVGLQQTNFADVLTEKLHGLDVWTKKLENSTLGYFMPAELYTDCQKYIKEAFEKDNNMILEEFNFYQRLDTRL